MYRYIILILFLLLSACTKESTLQKNQEKWEGQTIQHYRYSVGVSCFCPHAGMKATYEVMNGQVVNESFEALDGGQFDEVRISQFYRPYNTIENVFDYVERAINEADEITIEYEPTYGFPTRIAIDWIEMAVDDEVNLTLSNFEVLP